MTEYGRFIDTKKDWKAVSVTVSDIPNPSCPDKQTALPTHSVIVSGTVASTMPSPSSLGKGKVGVGTCSI